jgi:hypothetical protein
MSVHAGSILTVGGNNVIDRIQSAGAAGDVPIETIREVGNRLVVDKIPGEPDFTFTIESLDVSTELMAWLTGKIGGSLTDPTGFPGAADAAGTGYRWSDTGYVNVTSPWKDPLTLDQGIVQAGHIIPAYYPTRINYRFGVADNAGTTVELGGGSYYYGSYAPIEEFAQTDGVEDSWTTSENAIAHRIGGAAGTTFRSVFGVVVGGVAQIEGVDYSVGGGDGAPATVTFMVNGVATPPATGKLVRFCYFTDAQQAFPQAVHATTVVKPGAVRGRHIPIFLGAGGSRQRLASAQAFELEATVDSEVEREMGSEEPTGRVINGRDCNGSITVRSKDAPAFMALLAKVTGAPIDEVFGYLNMNELPLEVPILNPKNPGQVLKTLYVSDAIFQVPGTPARVNAPTDFTLRWSSRTGEFTEYKGAKP